MELLPNASGVPQPALLSTTIDNTGARSMLKSYFPSTVKARYSKPSVPVTFIYYNEYLQ
jgi:hypothetical protein